MIRRLNKTNCSKRYIDSVSGSVESIVDEMHHFVHTYVFFCPFIHQITL
jgi:hypothetical protein